MNRIAIICAILVWGLVIGAVGYSYIFGQQEDPREMVGQLVTVAKQYADDKAIDMAVITGNGPSSDFLRIMAKQFQDKQNIERELNTETKTLMATISLDNLANPALSDQAIAKADGYVALVEKKRAEFLSSIEAMNTKIRAMRGESEVFDVDVTITESVNIIKTHEQQAQMRVALGQYVKALLEFVKSRTGYYTVEESRLVFKTPEDQAYFDQLNVATQDIYKKLSDMIAQERIKFRTELTKINI